MKRHQNYMEIEISYGGELLTVSGTYEPEEMQVRYYSDMSGYPGAASNFEIDSIQSNGTEINDNLTDNEYDEIRELCLEKIEN